jgi:hypothetical protein
MEECAAFTSGLCVDPACARLHLVVAGKLDHAEFYQLREDSFRKAAPLGYVVLVNKFGDQIVLLHDSLGWRSFEPYYRASAMCSIVTSEVLEAVPDGFTLWCEREWDKGQRYVYLNAVALKRAPQIKV